MGWKHKSATWRKQHQQLIKKNIFSYKSFSRSFDEFTIQSVSVVFTRESLCFPKGKFEIKIYFLFCCSPERREKMMGMKIDVSKRKSWEKREWKWIDVRGFFSIFQIVAAALVALLAVISNLSVIECGQWVKRFLWCVKINAHFKWKIFFSFILRLNPAKPSKSKFHTKSTRFITITSRRFQLSRKSKFQLSKVSEN